MWAQLFNPLFPVYKFALILMLPLADFPVQINLFTEVTTYVTNNKQVLKHALGLTHCLQSVLILVLHLSRQGPVGLYKFNIMFKYNRCSHMNKNKNKNK